MAWVWWRGGGGGGGPYNRTIKPPSAMMACVPTMTLLTRDIMANTAESGVKTQADTSETGMAA